MYKFKWRPLTVLCTLVVAMETFLPSFLQVAAIGPTTAEALVNAGIQVDTTASKPNAESLVHVITSPVPR